MILYKIIILKLIKNKVRNKNFKVKINFKISNFFI